MFPHVQAINGALCLGPTGKTRAPFSPPLLDLSCQRVALLRDTQYKGKPDPFYTANVCVEGVSAKAAACGWCSVYLLSLRRMHADVRVFLIPRWRREGTRV